VTILTIKYFNAAISFTSHNQFLLPDGIISSFSTYKMLLLEYRETLSKALLFSLEIIIIMQIL
jgi:hypothetical protein